MSDLTEVLEETCILLAWHTDAGYPECFQQCKSQMFRYLKQTLHDSHVDLINIGNRLLEGCQKGTRHLSLIHPVPYMLTRLNRTPTRETFQLPEAELM